LIENLTELATVTCGGSWFAGIVAVTLGFRILLLPIVFKGMKNNYSMSNLRPQILQIQDKIKAYDAVGDDKNSQAEKMRMVELFRSNDVHPLRSLVPLVTQMPLFISFFMALRAMSTAPVSAMLCFWAIIAWIVSDIFPTSHHFYMSSHRQICSRGCASFE
jgi:YidC/Oxa1 family membrane protein insertase